MTSIEYKKVYNKFVSSNDVYYVSEHRRSYDRINEFKNFLYTKSKIVLLISVTRFEAEIAHKKLNELGIKTSIYHLVWLKPFIISKKLIDVINSSSHGAIILDNDFEGIPSILSQKLYKKINKKYMLCVLKIKLLAIIKKLITYLKFI